MNWKRLAIFCVSFLCFFFGEIAVNIACGGGEEDPYDYFTSFFQNDLNGKDFEQFRFSELVYLYSEEDGETEKEINVKEWANYLKIKDQDAALLYQLDSTASEVITKTLEKGKVVLDDSLAKKPFFVALHKNKKALTYYAFAKSCEPHASIDFDPWDPEVRDTMAMVQKAEEALKLMKKVQKDPFLKLRYAYQAERMYHYAGKYELSKSVYQRFLEKNNSASAVNGWAMSIYAGATRRTGDRSKAAYLFSKVFASNPERRSQTYKDFFFTSAQLDSVIPFAKNNEEQAFIYGIRGFGNADLDPFSIAKVHELYPKSEMVDVLMMRELNKLERRFLTTNRFSFYGRFEDMTANTKDETMSHLLAMEQFAIKLASDPLNGRSQLGWLSASYLNWMKGDFSKAKTYLSKLNPSKLTHKYLNQYRIIELLIKTSEINKNGTLNAQELLPALKWLDEQRFGERNAETFGNPDRHFTKITRDLYQQILAPIHLKNGDTALAALLLFKGDVIDQQAQSLYQAMSYETTNFWQNHLTPKSMEQLEDLRRNPSKDGYNGLLSSLMSHADRDHFYELFGTAYLRTHNYQKALDCFNKISEKYTFSAPSDWYNDQVLYASPFQTTINDYPKNYTSSAQSLDKKSFARTMLNLERKIKTDPKNASSYYYQMANGVYQTGYYGNSWAFISYNWSSYAYSDPVDCYYDVDYKLALTAKKWYLKARSLSTNLEFKAKCTFMLAKCEQKEQTNKLFTTNESVGRYYGGQGEYYTAINLTNKYFKELKNNYGKTAYFKKAIGECNYLIDFLNQQN